MKTLRKADKRSIDSKELSYAELDCSSYGTSDSGNRYAAAVLCMQSAPYKPKHNVSHRNLSHGSVLKCVSSMKYVYLDPYQRYNGIASAVDRLKRCAMINIENENRIQLKSPHFVRLFFALMLLYSTHFFFLIRN